MAWEYRCMKRHTHPPEHMKQFDEPWYEIIELYTDDDGSLSWTVEGMKPGGITAEECRHDYELMSESFSMPVLDEAQLEKEYDILPRLKHVGFLLGNY